ncbi:hypothetical protein V3C99_014035 [Haemonchus contortus]
MGNESDVRNLTDTESPSAYPIDGEIDRAVVLTTLITVSLISIIMHILFLKAIRSYCSWDSGFSFTLLFLISFNALLYFLSQFIALAVASSNLDEDHYYRLYRILGTLLLIPYFIMVALHVFLALHRFFYTVLPVQAKRFLRRPILKGCITFVIFYYITLFVLTQSDYMGTIFDPEYLFNFVLDLPYARDLLIMDSVSTYANLIINIPIYVSIFVILYIRKNISCRTSKEIQMTAQISFMVALELIFFYFWSFFIRDLTELEVLLAQVTTMLYFDAVIVPYVIFNRNVRQNVFMCWKRKASRVRNEIRVVPRERVFTSFSHIRHC